jgi:ATP-binding cassette subfamily B multidrug efflux pump
MMGGPRNMLQQEVSKPVKAGATLSRLARYFRPYWIVLIIVALLIIGSTWTQVITPNLTGQAVDCFITPASASRLTGSQGGFSGFTIPGQSSGQQQTSTNCWFSSLDPKTASTSDFVAGLAGLVGLVLLIFAAGSVMAGLQFYLIAWAGQHVLRNLRTEVFSHLHKLSLNYYAEHEAGNVMSRITNDMDTINQAISFALVNVLSGVLLLVWVAYTMIHINVAYGLISMIVVPLMIVVTNWISNRARKAYRVTRKQIGNVNADLQESISGVREVQAFGREDANIESFRDVNAANRDANITAVSITAALAPALQALGYLAIAIVVGVGGILMLRNKDLFGTTITLGLIITFLGYVQRFNQPIQQISTLWTNLQSAVAGAERIFGLLDTQPDVVDAPGAIEMPSIQGKVEFIDVNAAYVKDDPVLCGVSFTAEPGQTVAIVGPTGAGKTTIMNLLPRFYDVTSGQIKIDGYDISNVTAASLRNQIGIVLQDTYLFSDTVVNNIRFGKPDASQEEVVAAAQLAHADDFIQRLPQGYNTVLGEHGAGLSQGQRQLIAIARAALTDPRILILDEATSSVDTRTERLIQKALEKLLLGRTSFVIAHRLSTIRNADQVLVIEDGQIVERGRHEELLAKKGAYYNLYMRQFVTQKENGNGHQPAGDGSKPGEALASAGSGA